MVGKPLDDPAVLAYLADPKGFGSHLNDRKQVAACRPGHHRALRGSAPVSPVAALTRLTEQIEPVDQGRIEAAIATCRAENMRQDIGEEGLECPGGESR